MITLKSSHEIDLMRQAGKITAAARALAGEMVRPGVTTQEIDKAVEEFIRKQGAVPSFLGYSGFPASACISVNDEVIHGIPGKRVLQDGDIVLVTKPEYWSGNYQRGDVIICRYPNRNKESSISLGGSFELTFTNHTLFVKRLIGLPGDKIEFRQGVLYVNDQLVDESNIDVYIPYTRSMGPITLGRDQYFVVGDNRYNSHDSRDWNDASAENDVGPITGDMIIGKVHFVIFPFDNIRTIE